MILNIIIQKAQAFNGIVLKLPVLSTFFISLGVSAHVQYAYEKEGRQLYEDLPQRGEVSVSTRFRPCFFAFTHYRSLWDLKGRHKLDSKG